MRFMKTLWFPTFCVLALLAFGCASKPSDQVPTGQGVASYTYDVANDVTTVEQGGYTWMIKGNVTNVVANPVPLN